MKEGKMLKSVDSSSSSSLSSDESVARGNWVGKLDFIMSCVSYAVGLGNIWRFPYICYKNGGGVFLIPYLTFMILCGMPLFFLEVSYGQFASLSPITVWRLSPLFKGIGYGMVIISGIVCIYYNVIITWALYYLFNSFYPSLPWASCDNPWNTDRCATRTRHDVNATVVNATMGGNLTTGFPGYVVSQDEAGADGYDSVVSNFTAALNNTKKTTPSEEFWERHVLELSDGIEHMGGIRWELFGCLALAWVIVFLCLIRGIRSSGKVVYFTALFPYVVLLCLLGRAVTLPGAATGVLYYVVPQWDKLLELKVWGEAAMQIFYSVGAAWGALITMASYNKFNNNCYRDARIVPILNCGTSVFAGFVIYSIIGFMAYETNSTVDEVITKGPGLVFVVYPEAVAKLPLPQLWSVMFFMMILSVGIGSQIAMFQTLTSAFMDEFEWLRHKKVLFTATLCVAEFLLGIPCVARGGIYYLQVMDWYSSTFSLMILSFTELVVIAWIYGVERFYKDITLMIGFRPCFWWRACWCFITPILIMFVLMFSVIQHSPVEYGDGSYKYPWWALVIGWLFALCSIVPLPAIAINKILKAEGPLLQRVRSLVHYSREWGPALEEDRQAWLKSVNDERLARLSVNDVEAASHLNEDDHSNNEELKDMKNGRIHLNGKC